MCDFTFLRKLLGLKPKRQYKRGGMID